MRCARLHWVPEARTQICSQDEVSLWGKFQTTRGPSSSEGPLLASWGFLATAGHVVGDLGPGPAHHLPMAQGGCWPWGKGHRPPCPLADPDPERWGRAAPPSEPEGGLRWTPPT